MLREDFTYVNFHFGSQVLELYSMWNIEKIEKKNSSQKGQFKGLYDIFLLSHSNEFSQLKKYNLFQITITHLTIIQEYSC